MTAAILLLFAAAAVPPADLDQDANVEREMRAFNPDFEKLMRPRIARRRELDRQVLARESSCEHTDCSHQILTELDWLTANTADFPAIDQRLADLAATLVDPAREKLAIVQDAEGRWGGCSTHWFFKLTTSYDHLSQEQRFPQAPEGISSASTLPNNCAHTSMLYSSPTSPAPASTISAIQ